MGWGGAGGRGRSGNKNRGHQKADAQWKAEQEAPPAQEAAGCAGLAGHVPAVQPRPLAAQWRFSCRVLRRHAPEECVQDARRQLRLGDHVLVRYGWDQSEQHGIVCSAAGQERRERQEPHWVAHWDGERLQCSPLPQLAKGGELLRVLYPHWACRLLPPAASTGRPQVLEERLLEAAADEAVVRRANGALRGGWTPRWAQGAADLEFCLEAKTGGQGPPWELHGRQALASMPLGALGCQLRGERRPSLALGARAGAAGAAAHAGAAAGHASAPAHAGAAGHAAPPGFAAQPWAPPLPCVGAALPPQVLTVSDVEAYHHERYAAACAGPGAGAASWGDGWWDAGWAGAAAPHGAGAQKGAAGSALSPDAQVFVPQSKNWDGIYQ